MPNGTITSWSKEVKLEKKSLYVRILMERVDGTFAKSTIFRLAFHFFRQPIHKVVFSGMEITLLPASNHIKSEFFHS